MNAWVLMLDDDGVEQERCPAEFKDDVCVCETGCDDPAYVWTTASGMTYALCRTCIEADEYVRLSERPAFEVMECDAVDCEIISPHWVVYFGPVGISDHGSVEEATEMAELYVQQWEKEGPA